MIKRACGKPHRSFVLLAGDAFSEDDGAIERLRETASERIRQICRSIEPALHQRRQRPVRAALAHRTGDDVERVDVGGAFPEHADMGVAHEPLIDPFRDVAVATPHFHRIPSLPECCRDRRGISEAG